MRWEKWISGGIGMGLAFLLSFGGVGCMLSGFALAVVPMGTIALGCALMSALTAACYLHRRGDALAACAVALMLGYLWRRGTLVSSFKTLAYALSLRYDGGYGWGTVGQPGGSITLAALIIAGGIILPTVRGVCRRDSALTAMTMALLPLFSCMVVTDTVPGVGYLGCLLMGLILLLMTQSLRRSDPVQANTLTAMLAVPLAVALAVLFLAVPREGYVSRTEQWGQRLTAMAEKVPEIWESLAGEKNTVVGDGESQWVDLTHQGPKKQYSYTVMTVTAPTTGALYLRGQDYDSYTGTGWESTPGRKELFAGDGDVNWEFAGNVEISTRRGKDNLYYPYYTGKGQFLLEGGHIANTDGATAYSLAQYALPRGWESTLSDLPELGTSGLSRYRRLPEDTRSWAEELLSTILTGEVTDTQIAQTIGNYVRNSAEYDLNTPEMDKNYADFARWFLTESDRGYCVHFATAAAVLLRAAGVEARYVTGYMVWAQAGETVAVTAERAHAWVEYYESRLGLWVVLEATADAPQSGMEQTEATAATVQTLPQQTLPDTTQMTDGETPTLPQTGEAPSADDAFQHPESRESRYWLLLLLLPVALVGQYRLRRELRQRACRRGSPNQRTLALWREVTLLAHVLKTPPPRQLEALAQKARFSQHTLTPQELMLFEGWIREERRKMNNRPWYWKLLVYTLYAI